jgi:hypothetical protein
VNIKSPIKLILISLAFTALTSCALPGKIKSTEMNAVRKIAVVSELGNTFKGSFTATTIIGNKNFKADVSDWQVDAVLVETAISTLQRTGRTAFALPASDVKPDIQQQLESARVNGADSLILVSPSRYDNQADFPEGYGLHRRKIFHIDKTCVYSLFTVKIYNTTTGKPIGWTWSFPVSHGTISCTEGADIVWKDDFSKFTVEERKNLRRSILTSAPSKLNFWI